MDTHELLIKARALQAEAGHTKGILRDNAGHVCINGALLFNQWDGWHPDGLTAEVRQTYYEAVHTMGFTTIERMIAWNNAEERTLEDVLARFDQAIEATAPKATEPIPEPERELVLA